MPSSASLRDRLHLQEEIPDSALEGDREPPYLRPAEASPEHSTCMSDGRCSTDIPARVVHEHRAPAAPPGPEAFTEIYSGSGKVEASTTTAFTRLIRNLARVPGIRAPGGADRPG